MRFDILLQSRRLLAVALFSVFLVSCGEGEGPEQINDPLFQNVVPAPAPPPAGGGELLTNGDLEAGQAPWINQAAVVDDGGNNVLQGIVTAPDPGQPFLVNASQVLDITAGETYTLTFRARATTSRNMIAGIGLNVGPFTNVVETVPLTTDWQAYTYVLTANGFGGADSRVLFDMNGEAGDVFIDDVSLTAGSLLTNGDLEAGQAPWINQATVVDDGGNMVLQGVATAPDPGQPFLVNASQVLDITAGEKYVLTFKARGSVDRSMIAGIGLNVGPYTNNVDTVALSTAYETFTCTLTATGFGGVDSRVLFDMNAEAGDVFVDDIALALLGSTGAPAVDGCAGGGAGGGGGGGGELLTNGTFESGDTSGWSLVANNGTFDATMDQAASGAWSGNLVASVPGGGGPASFPVASQNNFAVGTVTPGQSVTVSFDMCGEITGAGGVVQTALLSEIAGGGASATDPLFGNITPTNTWTNYTMTVLSGIDVTGGITLQLKSDCGGNPGCTVNAYFDNVSVVLDSDVGNPSSAGGACPAAPPPPAPDGLPVDFEDAGGPYVFGDFGGGQTTVIDNPDMTGNSSAKVAEMKKFAGELYGATTLTLDGPIDLSSSEIITMKVWSQRVANVEFKVEGQPGNVTVIQPTSGVPGGVWETLTFDFTGLISDPVSAVSIFFDNGIAGDAAGDPVAWTFYVDDIELGSPSPPPMGGNLTTNGDFEAGDISGWADFSGPNNGAFMATNAQANSGTFSGNLTASVPGGGGPPSFPVVKQANIGIGTVTTNTDTFISFDLFGSVSGAGGVFFAEFFSELTGGGTSSAVLLGGGPLFPDNTWTNYTFTSPTGGDVSGGITLQLKADCGSNPGCTVDAFIDNVCVSQTPGACF